MGTGRDKRKKAKEKKDGPLPGKGADKTEAKTEKNEKKKEKRAEKAIAGDEDDIDALLKKFALEEAQKRSVQILENAPPPGPRVNASWIPYITPKGQDLFLFGGEHVDLSTDKVIVTNELFKFSCDRQKWTRLTIPLSPPPRSAHQSVIYKGAMYVFGGEFTSPNQERFLHYKDLWRLDLNTFEWDNLPMKKGGPSARSGHRMAVHGNRALLFGGFYDTGRDVKYYNDLWSFEFETRTWLCLGPTSAEGGAAATGLWPSARSGCGLVVHGDNLWVFGGYSKRPDDEDKDLEHGRAADDVWCLDLKKMAWEKVKKVGMAPGARASFSLAPHKNRALLFGGVSDTEARKGEDLSSDFHNDLYAFALDKRRWFAAEMKAPSKPDEDPKAAGAKGGLASGSIQEGACGQEEAEAGSDGPKPEVDPRLAALIKMGQDKNSPIYKAAVKIQARFRGYVVQKAYKAYKVGGVISEILYSPAAYGLDLSVLNLPKPRARINAMTSIVGNTLWMLGGIVEIGEKEITLDDMWSLDVTRMDGWRLIKENTVGDEIFREAQKAAEGLESEDEEEEEDDEEEDEDEEEDKGKKEKKEKEKEKKEKEKEKKEAEANKKKAAMVWGF